MGLFDFFKSEANCQTCQIKLPKKELNTFDSTFRGELRQGQKLKLCRKCFLKQITEAFTSYQSQAIITSPKKELNAYHFYSFPDMQKYNFDAEFIAGVKSKLPQESDICSCSKPANYLWASPEIYNNNIFDGEFNSTDDVQSEVICGECLSSKFITEIKNQDLQFDEFFPPVTEPGFAVSYEC